MREILAAAFVALLLSGCAFSNPFAQVSRPTGESGYLALQIVDSPLPGLRALNVTFSEVSAYGNGKWVLLDKGPHTFDMVALANKTAEFGRYPLAPGDYSKLRFKIKSVLAAFLELPKECVSLPFGDRDRSGCTPVVKKYSAKVTKSTFEAERVFSIATASDSVLVLDLGAESLARDTGKLVFAPLAALISPQEFDARLFNPKCGDGYCQKISCTGAGCPQIETPENCPADCAPAGTGSPPGEACVENDGICCLASNQSACSEALLLCSNGTPAAFAGCEFREGACFSLTECG
ncbi:MAG: DUF4382 domain-containing protein [Candidatus Micrarchaeota archaeon]